MTDSFDPPLRLPPTKPERKLVWVAGGSMDKCSVSLRFFGEDLDPDELTQILGVEPSSAYRKGDIFRGKKHDKIYKTGSWRLRSQRSDIDLEDQINGLLNKLPSDEVIAGSVVSRQSNDDLGVWLDLTTRFQVDLFCGLWMKRWNRCVDFQAAILQRIAERGLSIGLDIYVDYDLEEDSTEG
jgi:hypothetical protein